MQPGCTCQGEGELHLGGILLLVSSPECTHPISGGADSNHTCKPIFGANPTTTCLDLPQQAFGSKQDLLPCAPWLPLSDLLEEQVSAAALHSSKQDLLPAAPSALSNLGFLPFTARFP